MGKHSLRSAAPTVDVLDTLPAVDTTGPVAWPVLDYDRFPHPLTFEAPTSPAVRAPGEGGAATLHAPRGVAAPLTPARDEPPTVPGGSCGRGRCCRVVAPTADGVIR